MALQGATEGAQGLRRRPGLQLLVVQFFRLLADQFAGYLTVFVNLLLIGICRAMITREKRGSGEDVRDPQSAGLGRED